MSLTDKTVTGVLWTFLEQALQRGMGIIITLLLAKFLAPEHYGLIAMMAVFLAIANLIIDSGFSQALIRKQDAGQNDYNTAFYANILLSLLAYLLLFFAAPLIAGFFQQAQLTLLIRVAGITIPVNALRLVQNAIFTKQMNFRIQLKATIPSTMISGIAAIALAFAGFGVWALIAQMLISSVLLNLFFWSLSSWRPSMQTDMHSLKEMYGFGYKLFLSGLIDTIFKNIYIIIIAKLFSMTSAGYYFFSDRIRELITAQLVSSIQKVTYPALTTRQDDDVKLKEGYRKVIQVTTFLLFPAMALLAALTEPLFRILLPAKWLPAAPCLQLMCMAALMYPVHAINLNILNIKGRSDLFLRLEIFKKTLAMVTLLVTYRYGVYGILVGQVILSFIAFLPNSYYTRQLIDYSVEEQAWDFLPALFLSLGIAFVTWLALDYSALGSLTGLLVFGTLAATAYLLCAYLLKIRAFFIVRELLSRKTGNT